jgi:hypothetical protein
MAAPIRPIDPRPFVAHSVTLPDDATVVELDPQPFSNTKEIIFLNCSDADAGGGSALIQVARLQETTAYGWVDITGNASSGTFEPGETFTFDGVVLTATGGNQTSGNDDFSVGTRASGTITVNVAALTVGDTINLFPPGGAATLDAAFPGCSDYYILTGVSGPRVPGTRTFQVDAGSAAAIAASIHAAVIETVDFGWGYDVQDPDKATVLGSTVTIFADVVGDYLTRENQTCVEAAINTWSLSVNTAGGGDITVSGLSGGVNAEYISGNPVLESRGIFDTSGTLTRSDALIANGPDSLLYNLSVAVNDAGNSFATVTAENQTNVSLAATGSINIIKVYILAVASGSAGNGLVLSTTSAEAVVDSPTANGSDALPDAASITDDNSVVLPAGSAITLAIGSEGNRQPLADSTWWSTNPGSKLGIVLLAQSGTDIKVNVTYVQNRGYPDGV